MDDDILARLLNDIQNSSTSNSPSNLPFRIFDSNLKSEITDLLGSDQELVNNCDEFIAQVWRPDRCQNCFQTKLLHEQKQQQQQQSKNSKTKPTGLLARDTDYRC